MEAHMALSEFDRQLIAATQGGLPLVARPYDAIAERLGVRSAQVRERLAQMQQGGLIRRIGAVPNHYRLGFVANGMSVWDVDDAQVDSLGEQIGALPGVSHCYRRPRYVGIWPYNLFAMLHGRDRAEVEKQAEQLRALLGAACRAHEILYSTAILKKTGLRLARMGQNATTES
jgi:DNA-binding Lrp family transcriptional regulator